MEPFSFIKFFTGFKAWYKVLFIAVIAAACIGVYHKVFIQKTNNTQIEEVKTYIAQPQLTTFGCSNIKIPPK